MDWLVNLIPGGNFTVIAAGVIAAATAILAMFAGVKKAGRDEQKAKEADARAKNIDRIADAAAAKPRGSLSDDPNNRDNRPGRT